MARRLFAGIESAMLGAFDRVSTISRRMVRLLAAKGVAMDRTALLPNWVDLQDIHPQAGSPALRESLGITAAQTVFLFSGTMNRKQGLPVLFDALDLLAGRSDIVLVLCGAGEMRAGVEARAEGRANVRLLGLQPQARLNELLNMADVHLLPQLAGAADLVMPSKLAGMLASGRPMIAGAVPGTEIARVVDGRGLVVEPENAVAYASAMLQLADDAALRLRLGAEARAYAERTIDQRVVLDRLATGLTPSAVPARPIVVEPAEINAA
jgi:colanic acid biosynthesis glycosyl transferase WcaI